MDRTPPRTRLTHHPPKLLTSARSRRRVSFAFASEAGARFRCRLDRRPTTTCTSPRGYRVGIGPHAFRVFAIDRAGNADPSPALYRFTVRRLKRR